MVVNGKLRSMMGIEFHRRGKWWKKKFLLKFVGMNGMNKFMAWWWSGMTGTKWNVISNIKVFSWWFEWFNCEVDVLKFKEIH